MKVLLSIKPEHAAKIFDGTKKFEFRKTVFRSKDVSVAVVYVTQPVARIVGEFDVKEILCERPDNLWKITSKKAGISKSFFDLYFRGRQKSFAIAVGDVRRYGTPLDPASVIDNFTAPQSYMYIEDDLRRPVLQQLALPI